MRKVESPQIVRGQSVDTEQRDMFEAMRKRLAAFRTLNEEIDNEIERLERLEDRASSASSPNLTGMPKAPSPVQDRMAYMVAQIVDLKSEIEELVMERETERKAIEALVKQLDKACERAVIRSRYLDLEEWEDVQFVLFGSKADFGDKYDDYKQRMFRWHRSAIYNLASLCR